ncbi:MAG: MlrC C-terminal domain-containing protein, partial [Rickettsiales bacterium]
VEPIAESIAAARAIAPGEGPVMLIDHGDNCGSGGNQDVMAVLAEVIAQGLENVCAGPFSDPEAVAEMIDAGVGAQVTVKLGGKVDMPAMSLTGDPVTVTGTVKRITDGSFTVTGPMFTGVKLNIGRTVVLDTGKVEIVVSEGRYEPFDQGCFTHAGIDPAKKSYVLLKSRQHFRAGFEPIAREIVMISGPGTCTSDYTLFPWKDLR